MNETAPHQLPHHLPHHLHWGAEALWEELNPLLPGLSVEVQARVESTNTKLLDRARQTGGDPDTPISRPGELDTSPGARRTPHGRRAGDLLPCLLVAEQQTRGRGRLGRDWVSSVGASLTFSLALPLAPAQWAGLSLAVGLALAEALDPLPGIGTPAAAPPRIVLKWPNDLWLLDGAALGAPGPVRGRKLGGILIETISVGTSRLAVVGVGLNVLPQPATLAAGMADGLTHGYACLQEIDPAITAPHALALLARPLVQTLKQFEAEGFAPLVARYGRRDLLLGQAVSVSGPEPLQGVAQGVDEQGALLVHAGGVRRVVSGEVSVRLAGQG